MLPAFPALRILNDAVSNESGMTLRDYFAAKALAALIVEPPWGAVRGEGEALVHTVASPNDATAGVFARSAYKLADAMLKAREA